MGMRIYRGNQFVSFMIGIFLPCAGFYLIQWLFKTAELQGWVDIASDSIDSRRMRTMTLIAICLNLIPLRLFTNRKESLSIRGLVTATMLLAVFWLYWFYDSLYP